MVGEYKVAVVNCEMEARTVTGGLEHVYILMPSDGKTLWVLI